MPIANPARVIAAPAVNPYRFGLLSVAQILPTENLFDGFQWEAINCAPAEAVGVPCPEPDETGTRPPVPGIPKVFARQDGLIEVEPFVVYGNYSCPPVGRSFDDARERALAHLRNGEDRTVESIFMSGGFNNMRTLSGPDTTDLTPVTGAVSVSVGVAMLESFAGDNIAGTAVLHMPRMIGALACGDDLVHRGTPERLETCLGSYVAAGAGYSSNIGPDGTEAPAGEAWIYVTDRPVVWRSEAIVTPDNIEGALDRTVNEVNVIAERVYGIGYQCPAAAVRVKVC